VLVFHTKEGGQYHPIAQINNENTTNKMANKDIEPRWEKGESGEKNGRPKGSKNRATIVKKWLEVNQNLKNPLTGQDEFLTQEDLITLAIIKRARDGNVNAYNALMDSGYGSPAQTVNQTITEYPIFPGIDLNVDKDDSSAEDI